MFVPRTSLQLDLATVMQNTLGLLHKLSFPLKSPFHFHCGFVYVIRVHLLLQFLQFLSFTHRAALPHLLTPAPCLQYVCYVWLCYAMLCYTMRKWALQIVLLICLLVAKLKSYQCNIYCL